MYDNPLILLSDLDECSSDTLNDCTSKGMTCKNVVGYYTCLCPAGYRRIGTADACVGKLCEPTPNSEFKLHGTTVYWHTALR